MQSRDLAALPEYESASHTYETNHAYETSHAYETVDALNISTDAELRHDNNAVLSARNHDANKGCHGNQASCYQDDDDDGYLHVVPDVSTSRVSGDVVQCDVRSQCSSKSDGGSAVPFDAYLQLVSS